MNSTQDLKSVIFNITMVFYQYTLNTLYEEVDGELRFTVKHLQDIPEMYSRYTKSRIKLKLIEEGQWGVWKEGVGYTDGMFGALQNNEANKAFLPVPFDTKDPPGVFTSALEELSYHLASVTQEIIPDSSFDLLNNLVSIELFCWLLYFTLLFTIFSISNLVHLPKLDNLKYRFCDVIIETIQAILTGQIFSSTKTYFLLTFACLLTALFGAVINASFKTTAIVRSDKEIVNSLADIIKFNKDPWFFDGVSQYDLFTAGVTPEFKQVYDYAVKKGLSTPKAFVESTSSLLSRDICFNAVTLTSLRTTQFIKIYLEYYCSSELETAQNVFVSNPYHKTIRMSLFNPCTDGLVAEEMIRRDKAYHSVLLETGIILHSAELLKDFAIESSVSLLGLKNKRQPDDSDLYSLSASPLKFYNFKDLFVLQFIAALIALFIELGSQIYHRYIKLNLKLN